jgi:hypothetical protein
LHEKPSGYQPERVSRFNGRVSKWHAGAVTQICFKGHEVKKQWIGMLQLQLTDALTVVVLNDVALQRIVRSSQAMTLVVYLHQPLKHVCHFFTESGCGFATAFASQHSLNHFDHRPTFKLPHLGT